MNVSASHSSLADLVQWNQTPAATDSSQTTVATAQQTLAQTPSQVLASVPPANTSLYGTAPAVDSLLGNISTSAGLNALAQVNAGRTVSGNQISPFGSSSDAVSYGQSAQANVASTLLSGLMGHSGPAASLLAAYFPEKEVTISSPDVTGSVTS